MIVSRRFRSLSPLLLVSTSAAAVAQVPAPEPSATLPPIIYSLPGTAAPAASPSPTATPVPVETSAPPVVAAPRGVPTPRATPTARATPAVRATPSPEARATSTTRERAVEPAPTTVPAAVVEPLPTPTATLAAPAPDATPEPAASSDTPGFGWYLPLGIVLALAAGGPWLWRRRRSDEDATALLSEPEVVPEAPVPELGVPETAVPESSGAEQAVAMPTMAQAAPRMLSRRSAVAAPSAAAADLRAWIELELRPRRAGLNLLTATADVELLVRNRGEGEATNVRIDARLTSARSDQDAELGQVFAETQGRLAAPAFTLAPGGERVVRALVTLPRDAINVLTAAGRPMFVPVVTLNARYTLGGERAGEGQTAQAFALGIERADSAKLAPFWLDTPSRMVETVAARPHALAIAS